MEDVTHSTAALLELRSQGVRVAIDHFGTGYASLSYLGRLSVDILKIDKSFVDGLGRNPESEAVVAAVVSLAHTLGLETIAEGIEIPAQLAYLKKLGCDQGQGYHIRRPAEAAAASGILETVFSI